MTTYHAARVITTEGRFTAVVKAVVAEVTAFFDAILRPGKIIAEVERMQALHDEARRVETSDPARAARLRRLAARVGL